jgi:hypothetical protein
LINQSGKVVLALSAIVTANFLGSYFCLVEGVEPGAICKSPGELVD